MKKKNAQSSQRTNLEKVVLFILLYAGTSVLFSESANAATCAADAWKEGTSYKAGNIARYGGHNYVALTSHVALAGAGWAPPRYPVLWKDTGECTAESTVAQNAPLKPAASTSTASSQGPAGGSGWSGGGGSMSGASVGTGSSQPQIATPSQQTQTQNTAAATTQGTAPPVPTTQSPL